ncbi:uncharacterized protein LOC121505010 [Cheilinus undulatus]|uniref:uncharacterized protein LOC121505010 n=1 Tax=Cheilinus undulatus TaxID=241271 RepID=UPI001BD6B843|nr:uncharacterized protein LOC121505010 [Cheilinus undulatus]
MNLASIPAVLLCSLSWLSVSASEAQTVEVQSNEDATLMCSNMTINRNATFWFRLVEEKDIQCISFKTSLNSKVEHCPGIHPARYKMWSSSASISLKISSVNTFDSGTYYCGFYSKGRPVFRVKHLKIRGQGSDEAQESTVSECTKECGETSKLVSLILCGLAVFLVMVIVGLVIQIRKLQTAAAEQKNSQRQAGRREPEPDAVYANVR